MEEVYESCTPLLLSAMSRLIRSGYRIDPSLGLDLIHDFYLEALPGLFTRYESGRGRFSTYLYGAFLRFARPRIIRNMRWSGVVADLDRYPAPAAADDVGFSSGDISISVTALAQMPAIPRAVLKARIVDGLSERETARHLELSRYLVRQHTAEGLGRLAIALGQDERIPDDVRPLAIRLWRDEQTLMQAARDLGWTRPQALNAYHSLLNRLAAILVRST
jgi:DNA-directed RNA polymerase specialized sigma24 family protein